MLENFKFTINGKDNKEENKYKGHAHKKIEKIEMCRRIGEHTQLHKG